MNNKEIQMLCNEWDAVIGTVLDMKELSADRVQVLFKRSYEVLSGYQRSESVPKEICRLLLCLNDFDYFSATMEENEVGKGFYHWEECRYIVTALKEGFLKGKYSTEYPKLLVSDVVRNEFIVDLENDRIEQYFVAVLDAKTQEL